MDDVVELSRVQREFMRLHFEMNHKTAVRLGLYYGQPVVLMSLLENKEMTQRDLANEMNITPASVNVSIKRLEKAGMVKKSISKTDKRVTYICLTDEGKKTAEKCREGFEQNEKLLFKGFSENEITFMKNLYIKMSKNIRKEM